MKAYLLGIYTSDTSVFPDIKHLNCDSNIFTLCNCLGKIIKSELPTFSDPELLWSYIRGYFDRNGTIVVSSSICKIITHNAEFAVNLGQKSEIPHEVYNNVIVYKDVNAIDFLGNMYKNKERDLFDYCNYEIFKKFINPQNILPGICHVYKEDDNAILPSKGKYTDVGYDLTIIKSVKEWNNKTVLYDTGIKVKVQSGYYAEVVPRSSLSKSGYMLANSVGIIDPNYTGNILIALTKVDDSAPDLELPFRCCQLIFRRNNIMELIESKDDFESTTRCENGFGSTGV
jgi:deoxyuridine 5'-triphosphate nucleotidohydrolase